MAYQNITGSLTPADIQEIKAAFAIIQAKLPFLVTLSVEKRRKLFKATATSAHKSLSTA
ncbi:hypothetical protein [Nostoc sp. FACHB-133]|uniref:hypothetical protein n=1 Tax=Nostoc sp. FACHB-133 TaxID=2692835 RepID=UPI00168204EB|nr:hypothetical protein [Nostoc sp. FACHB-133]MBD2521606.1 hypothetical protein [Nostoc sp. FACHB-133]